MDGFTNVCEATSQSHGFDGFRTTHRKGKKLMAEKKRRARINNCLIQIRDIVCNGDEAKDTDLDKMEKAEILEKTLEVLTRLRYDYACSSRRDTPPTHKSMVGRYVSGFSSCAEESIRYIQNSRLVPAEVKQHLQVHLRSMARKLESRVGEVSALPTLNAAAILSQPVSMVAGASEPLLLRHPMDALQPQSSRSDLDKVSYDKNDFRIPSPIHTSTPVFAPDESGASPSTQVSFHFGSQSPAIVPAFSAPADFALEHKENHPHHTAFNTPGQENIHLSNNPALSFHKLRPSTDCLPPLVSSSQVPVLSSKPCSPRGDSPLPHWAPSSQYSPISPAPAYSCTRPSLPPTPTHAQEMCCHPNCQPAYTPMADTFSSYSPSSGGHALNLCVKRAHQPTISPETMWRPW